MKHRNQFIIVYCAIVAVSILYEPQTLLPILAQLWNRSLSDVALITTVSMLPLAIAPLFYGYLLERLSSKSLLMGSFSILLIAQIILSTAPDYYLFIVLRGIQGLMLPAILTSLMTYSSASGGQSNSRKNVSFYIAATIVGGFSGRVITGSVAEMSDWQTAFWMWAILSVFAVFSLTKLDSDPRGELLKISFKEIKSLIAKPINKIGLMSAFFLFFVTSSIMNFLPFRMLDLKPDISTGDLSLVYSGYMIGVVIAIFSTRLVILFGSEKRTLLSAGIIYLSGCSLFLLDVVSLYYFAMFILMAGMFTIHSVLSAYLNHLEISRKGMINGLYVSSYYFGGAVGSFFPGLIYQNYGWTVFCFFLMSQILLLIYLFSQLTSENNPKLA